MFRKILGYVLCLLLISITAHAGMSTLFFRGTSGETSPMCSSCPDSGIEADLLCNNMEAPGDQCSMAQWELDTGSTFNFSGSLSGYEDCLDGGSYNIIITIAEDSGAGEGAAYYKTITSDTSLALKYDFVITVDGMTQADSNEIMIAGFYQDTTLVAIAMIEDDLNNGRVLQMRYRDASTSNNTLEDTDTGIALNTQYEILLEWTQTSLARLTLSYPGGGSVIDTITDTSVAADVSVNRIIIGSLDANTSITNDDSDTDWQMHIDNIRADTTAEPPDCTD